MGDANPIGLADGSFEQDTPQDGPASSSEAIAFDVALQHLVDVNTADASGRSLLWWSSGVRQESAAVALLHALLSHRALVNAVDTSGVSPLQRAATQGHSAAAQLLLA